MPRILTVDDSALTRTTVRRALAGFDVELLEAADGEAGLAAIRAQSPDLVLLDYNMPVLDGVGLLRQLRAEPAIARTRVLLLTANATPAVLAEVARLGVRDYLVKPFNDAALQGRIARQVDLQPRAGA
jgi:two-component system, cell cycle response regulator